MTPFAEVGAKLLANGYSPIPIMPGTKVPGQYLAGAWKFYKGWNLYCTRVPSELLVRGWSNWPDAGVGVACGRGLICIDIDDEKITDAILGLLPPSPVQKKGRKGLSLFYRGDTDKIKSRNYRTKEKAGLLDLIAEGKQTVLPPSIHPDTGEPYYWWTDATLCNTTLSEFPELPDDIAEKIAEVLKRFGYDPDADRHAPAPQGDVSHDASNGEEKSAYRRINDAALANLRAWVTDLNLYKGQWDGQSYRAVPHWRPSTSSRPLDVRKRSLSISPKGIEDFAGEKYTALSLVMKALDIPQSSLDDAYVWLAERLGIDTGPKIKLVNTSKAVATPEQRGGSASVPAPSVQATYADHSVPFDIGVQKLREAIAGFETVMREWRESQKADKKPLITPNPPVNVIKIGTSAGKTHETAAKIATWLPRGYRIAVAVPDHKMARQVAETIGAHDVSVEIYRGYTQPDPLAPEHKMCRTYKAACDLGVSIRRAVCTRSDDDPLVGRHRCHAIDFCGHERQRDLKPDVWVVTHATLLYARPDFIAELDGLVIDEKFFDKTIGKSQPESDDDQKSQPNADEKKAISKPQTIDVVVVRNSKVEEIYDDEERVFLKKMRSRLADAVLSNGNGFLSLRAVRGAGISTEDAAKAKWLEKSRLSSTALTPGMRKDELKDQVTLHRVPNKQARVLAAVWEEIETLLDRAHESSGRLKVVDSKVTVTQHRPVHPSWHAPTLALDATAASPEILQQALFGDSAWRPCRVTVTDIAIERPYYVHVRQVFGA